MDKIRETIKAIAGAVSIGAVATQGVLIAAGVDVPLWLLIGTAVVGAYAVWQVPNAPTARQRDTILAEQAPLTSDERQAAIDAAVTSTGRHSA